MLKFLTFLAVSAATAGVLVAQVKKQFSVEKADDCQEVRVYLKTKTGNCFIRPSHNTEVLTIYSNQDFEEYAHSFKNEVVNNACHINLDLIQQNKQGIGRNISDRVFGAEERLSEKFWKVYLSEAVPYILQLEYGLGNANIDLSGLAIKRFKINTGSADVQIDYSSGKNKIEMDTFWVKVDFGRVSVKQIAMSRSKTVIADVGFGNMMLDFSGVHSKGKQIKGSVGAGNLMIILPDDSVPVEVKINSSWLCNVQPIKGMKKINETTYVNQAFKDDTKNALSFDLDVSMGNIIFREKKY